MDDCAPSTSTWQPRAGHAGTGREGYICHWLPWWIPQGLSLPSLAFTSVHMGRTTITWSWWMPGLNAEGAMAVGSSTQRTDLPLTEPCRNLRPGPDLRRRLRRLSAWPPIGSADRTMIVTGRRTGSGGNPVRNTHPDPTGCERSARTDRRWDRDNRRRRRAGRGGGHP
jgi:hypothetical protein